MSAATIIIRHRKRLIRRFKEVGALSPDHTTTLDSLGEHSNWIFRQMVRHGVFLETTPEHYYMDELRALEFMRERRKRALVLFGLLSAIMLILWCISRL